MLNTTSKRVAALCVNLMMTLGAIADNVPSMVIEKTDGSKVTVEISAIRSIKFVDGVMVINHRDDSSQQVEVDAVAIMTFDSTTTAILAVTGKDGNQVMTITDLSGRVVYQGLPKGFHGILRGMYIIKTDGRSQKVCVK